MKEDSKLSKGGGDGVGVVPKEGDDVSDEDEDFHAVEKILGPDGPGEMGKGIVIDKDKLSPEERKKFDLGWTVRYVLIFVVANYKLDEMGRL